MISHLPEHKIYVEPFGGGASVLLRKPPSKHEIYNDLDDEIASVFRVLRNKEQALQLYELLDLTPYSPAEIPIAYERTEDPVENARRVIVRSYFLFANDSIFRRDRTFRRGPRNNHAQSWSNFIEAFTAFHQRLSGVTIENLPAEKLIRVYDSPETLFYVDPPYVSSTRSQGKYRHEMTDCDHRDLATLLHGVKGKVVISGYASPLYDELYRGWDRHEKLNFNVANRPAMEVLWIKP